MFWLQQQPFFWPWWMQFSPVDNHPEIQKASAKIIFLAHCMLLLHSSTSYSSISSAISCSPSLSKPFTAYSCPPHHLQFDIRKSVLLPYHCLVIRAFTPYLFGFYLLILLYYTGTLILLCCFLRLGGVLHKNQWNENMNLLKGTSLFQQWLSASGNMLIQYWN